jgi:hypothetical protein
VINHACAISGIPFTFDPVGELIVAEAKGGRNGREGTYGTAVLDGSPVVTKREGPNGSPWL